jgi:aminocarboxymuconate-semialdehyde decarboxylase
MPGVAVDVHAHTHVAAVDQLVAGKPGLTHELEAAPRVLGVASVERNRELFLEQWRHALSDVDARRLTMNRSGIDVQVVSVTPLQYHAWADRGLATDIVAATNESVANLVTKDPSRFSGLAAASLQHPDLACAQLTHAMTALGMRGVEVPTRAGNLDFSAPELEEFWSTAEALGAVIFIHPWGCTLDERLAPFYLGNVVGNPTETTVALSHLIFGGVLDRHPGLKVCAAHGGGYLPYYIGRSDHAWTVRPEARTTERPPSEYLAAMWFDSLVYRSDTLRALIDTVGARRVVLGTDYPYDMGVDDPIARLDDVAGLSDDDRSAILGGNAIELFGLDVPQVLP